MAATHAGCTQRTQAHTRARVSPSRPLPPRPSLPLATRGVPTVTPTVTVPWPAGATWESLAFGWLTVRKTPRPQLPIPIWGMGPGRGGGDWTPWAQKVGSQWSRPGIFPESGRLPWRAGSSAGSDVGLPPTWPQDPTGPPPAHLGSAGKGVVPSGCSGTSPLTPDSSGGTQGPLSPAPWAVRATTSLLLAALRVRVPTEAWLRPQPCCLWSSCLDVTSLKVSDV